MTEKQRNAVIRLIDAAEIVIADFERDNLDKTRHAVKRMKAEIALIRAAEDDNTTPEFVGGGE